MNQREKLLVGAVALLIVGWGLWQGAGSYLAGIDRKTAEVARLDRELFDQQLESRGARQSMRRLESYQTQSLPADVDVARSAYAAWLVEAIDAAGLDLDDVRLAGSRRLPGTYHALTFNAEATGAPEAVVRLLDAYHRLGLLHQMSKLQIAPADGEANEWRVSLTSVALVVDGTMREAGVPDPVAGERLRLARVDDYVDSVVGRNLFASYTPPPPPAPPRPKVVKKKAKPKPSPPAFDHAEHAQLTGVVETGDRLEAWVRVRTTGETLRLHAGDPFEVGSLKGRVLSVLPREMRLEADGREWRAKLGEMLRKEGAGEGV